MSHILLTGATGLLGRYLMRDIMTRGVPMAVLVRPSRRMAPVDRIESAMLAWEKLLGRKLPRPKVLAGDISRPDFGLDADDVRWVRDNCSSIIHNAASLAFVTTGRHAEPWTTNVDGTRIVLDFCEKNDLRDVFQVSTAYVAGKRTGSALESELNVGQEFANCYEESKVEAEEMVRNAEFIKTLTVFRPGIIIGDSNNGLTFTYHNFYAALQITQVLIRQLGEFDYSGRCASKDIMINVDGHERKYLVPVDWVSEAMARVVTTPDLHDETYHLTPRIPITMRLFRDILEEALDLYGTGFSGAGERVRMNTDIDEIFFEQMQVYQSYWKDDPHFDSTNIQRALPDLPCPHVDRRLMLEMARWAIDHRFSWKDPSPSRESELVSS